MSICSVHGCAKQVVARGFCDMHYRRFKRGAALCDEPKGSIAKDHTGSKFGRWEVLSRASNKGNRTAWACKCECGTEASVLTCHLVSGKSVSCGCYALEQRSEPKTHGLADTGEYRIWCLMKGRCLNPNIPDYPSYGGRGISVCDRWLNDFVAFYVDMGPRPSPHHSIDRINVNGNYEPENCRWATAKEQARNTRRNKFYVINGRRMSLPEAVEMHGGNYGTVKWRLRQGQSIEQALGLVDGAA